MSDRTEHPDQTTMLVAHAGAWRAGTAEKKDVPPTPEDSSTGRDLTTVERAAALRSARDATHAYPGPVGDVIKTTIEESPPRRAITTTASRRRTSREAVAGGATERLRTRTATACHDVYVVMVQREHPAR